MRLRHGMRKAQNSSAVKPDKPEEIDELDELGSVNPRRGQTKTTHQTVTAEWWGRPNIAGRSARLEKGPPIMPTHEDVNYIISSNIRLVKPDSTVALIQSIERTRAANRERILRSSLLLASAARPVLGSAAPLRPAPPAKSSPPLTIPVCGDHRDLLVRAPQRSHRLVARLRSASSSSEHSETATPRSARRYCHAATPHACRAKPPPPPPRSSPRHARLSTQTE
jgi:hypothetical protein